MVRLRVRNTRTHTHSSVGLAGERADKGYGLTVRFFANPTFLNATYLI